MAETAELKEKGLVMILLAWIFRTEKSKQDFDCICDRNKVDEISSYKEIESQL